VSFSVGGCSVDVPFRVKATACTRHRSEHCFIRAAIGIKRDSMIVVFDCSDEQRERLFCALSISDG
jgi:hypothetical protein